VAKELLKEAVEKGLEDAAAGRTLSHEEVGRRLGL